jgi:Ca2+-binding EF-hand superfamily protein
MKASIRTAVIFAAFSAALGGIAVAQDMPPMGGDGPMGFHAPMARLAKAVKDHDGAVTFEEFQAALPDIMKADANGDGKVTVEELAAYIEKMRAERAARRIMERLAGDPNGTLTEAAVADREHKMFALLDRNNDGKIEKDELPHRPFFRHSSWRPMGGEQ